MISLAVDLAERQMREGTASPSIIAHYLKLGSTREHVEREVLQEQAKLVKAKTEGLESAKKTEAVYKEVVDAIKSYGTDS